MDMHDVMQTKTGTDEPLFVHFVQHGFAGWLPCHTSATRKSIVPTYP